MQTGRLLVVRGFVWLILGLACALVSGFDPASALAQDTGGKVRAIRVDGTERIEPETVQSYLTVKIGDVLTAEGIDSSLKALFATGLFADASVGREGDTMVVKVTENPIINRVAFEGNRKLETDSLQNEVQLKPRSVYTRTKVQNDVKRLLDVYRRNGRFAATVEPKIIKQAQNRVDLVFEINEGGSTGIGRISFVGNKIFSDSELRAELQTKESAWYRFLSSDDHYDPDRVTFDRELLRRFYLKNGYADFRVLSAVAELSPDRNSFYLTFTVDEGERYTFSNIDISTTLKNLDVPALREKIEAQPGDWYDAGIVDDTITLLSNQVGTLGYAFVEVEPDIKRDRENRTIGITFDIREGPKVYVERIDITGNVRTLDEVIRREFRLVEGDAFNTEKLKRSEKRLKDIGFFKKVEVANTQGSSPDRTILQAKVEEQSTGELSIGAGYSTTDGVLGQLNIGERNLLGRGQSLRFATTIAQRRQEFDVSFTEPYFLDRELAFGVDLFRITRNLEQDSSFDSEATGIAFSLGYLLNENLRQTLRYTIRNDRITNVATTASRFIMEQQGQRVSSIVSQDLTYDRLDDKLDPTRGFILSLSDDLSGLGGDVHYVRTEAKAAVYHQLAKDYVLSLRGDAGYIVGLGERVRINDRFFLGGDNLRGFRVGGAGPRDVVAGDALGADILYTTTLELSVPLGLPKELGLSGRIFTDAGSSFKSDESGPEVRDTSGLRASAGVGVSWKSPFGPIRLDLAVPYIKENYDRSEFFRFSFGTRF